MRHTPDWKPMTTITGCSRNPRVHVAGIVLAVASFVPGCAGSTPSLDAGTSSDASEPVGDAGAEGCLPTVLGCRPVPFAATSITGERVWFGLGPDEEPPEEGEEPPSFPVLAPTQEVRVQALDAFATARLPSHADPVDRVYLSEDSAVSFFTAELAAAVLSEICRINERRPANEVAEVVIATSGSEEELRTYLTANGCGTEPDGRPRFVRFAIGAGREIWSQDSQEFLEVGVARPDGTMVSTTAAFATPQQRSVTTETLVMTERYPFLSTLLAAGADTRGGAGGNIEVLPDGRLLLGDSAIPSMQAWVRARGGIVLPAQWLHVGHVDEWLTVRGDGAVVYADPVLGLDLVVRSGEPAWTEMQGWVARAADKHPELSSYLTLAVTFEDMEAAIRSYLRDPAQTPPYQLADFDFATAPMALPLSVQSRVSRTGGWGRRLIPLTEEQRLLVARWVVYSSLDAAASIEPGLETLRTAGIRLVPTPELHYKDSTLFPSAINALWLDDVVLTADPFYTPFRTAFRRAVGRRVEFLDGVKPWQLQGGIHCATQVSRRPPCPLTAPRETLTFDHTELRCSSEDPCSAAMTCEECNGVGFAACGWCPGTGCVSASEMDRCESGWADRITECVDCGARTTCGECTDRNAFCGWCGSSCVPHSAMSEESCGGDYRTFADGCG